MKILSLTNCCLSYSLTTDADKTNSLEDAGKKRSLLSTVNRLICCSLFFSFIGLVFEFGASENLLSWRGFVPAAQADDFDLALSDQTIKVDLYSLFSKSSKGTIESSFLHNDESRNLASIGLHLSSETYPLKLMIGGKTYYSEIGSEEGFGLALGGKADFSLGSKVYLRAQAYYSPLVTSFDNNEHYKESGLQIVYKAIPDCYVFLGYRNVKIDIEDLGDMEIHKGGFAGVSMRF